MLESWQRIPPNDNYLSDTYYLFIEIISKTSDITSLFDKGYFKYFTFYLCEFYRFMDPRLNFCVDVFFVFRAGRMLDPSKGSDTSVTSQVLPLFLFLYHILNSFVPVYLLNYIAIRLASFQRPKHHILSMFYT